MGLARVSSAMAATVDFRVFLNIGSLLRAQPIKPGRGQGSLDGATPGTKEIRERCRVCRVDRRDDLDIAIREPTNLRFPAKILIFRPPCSVTRTTSATTAAAR
jgi:hypothetical protein